MSQTPSSFSHLFTSNNPVQQHDAIAIRREINGMTEVINNLEDQLRQHRERRQTYRSLLSPLRGIPLEILGEIFDIMLALPLPKFKFLNQAEEIINLCLVSKHWRDAAIATHQLWTSVTVGTLPISALGYERVKCWVQRAGGLPKRLEVDGHDQDECQGPEECDLADPMLTKLLLNGPDLHHLSIRCISSQCLWNLVGLMKEQGLLGASSTWTSIKSFKLQIHSGWADSVPGSIFHLFPPALTSLSLNLPPVGFFEDYEDDEDDWPDKPFHIPDTVLPGLKAFELGCNWGPSSLSRALSWSSSRVEILTISMKSSFIPFIREATNREVFTFPYLRTFHLKNTWPGVAPEILRACNTPSLLELSVDFDPYEDPDLFMPGEEMPDIRKDLPEPDVDEEFSRSLISLVRRSQCPLKKFRLRTAKVPTSGIKKLLKALPDLTHLTLDNADFGDGTMFRGLGILPKLQVLELINLPTEGTSFNAMEVGRFIRKRQSRVSKLESPDVDTLTTLTMTYRKPDSFKRIEDEFQSLNVFLLLSDSIQTMTWTICCAESSDEEREGEDGDGD